nr:hypothetical protein [Candidatus Njordarchaeota archaeon]
MSLKRLTLLRIVSKHLTEKCGIKTCDSDEVDQFTRLVASGDDHAKRKIAEVLLKVADQKGFLPEE